MVKIILREVRKGKNLSIKKLSILSGVSTGHISNIENGLKMPTIDVLVRLAAALGVKPEELYQVQ